MTLFIELVLMGVGLAMDAFAVSVCKGLGMTRLNKKQALIIGLYFGGFQALMPLIGYFAGRVLSDFVTNYSHWIAFILLAIIGVSMIKESFGDKEEVDASMDVKSMFLLAVATSIDALMVGVTFAFLNVAIVPAVLFIGATTFVCSAVGVKIGSIFGMRYKSRAELCGGIILILIGLKIVLEGIGLL